MPDRAPPRFAARAVLAARIGLDRLGDRILPADLAAFSHTLDFALAFTMRALAEREVPEALAAGPRTAGEVAAEKGLHADTLHRLLRYAALNGLVKLDRRGRFSLTRTGRLLRADHPASIRPWLLYVTSPSTQRAWAHVSETLVTGEPSFPAVHGESIWSYFEKHPDEERQFAASMRRVTEIDVPNVVAGYDWPETATVCDVGGGVGTLLAGVLGARPGLRGVLVDARGVLAEAEAHLEKAGVRDRVELREGNFFERVDAEADVYLMKDVIHDWDDERCRTILRTVRATMKPGSRLVLVENLQERNVVEPIATWVDVHMLTQTDGGRQRSVAELQGLMGEVGLRPGTVTRTAGPGLVEGIA